MLRPRAEQEKSLERLRAEIEELERESEGYREVWKERREQFGRIVEEGRGLRRLIRGELEDVEGREGIEGVDSNVGTPGAGEATPLHDSMEGGLRPAMLRQGGVGRLSPGLTTTVGTPASTDDRDVPMRGISEAEGEGNDEGEIAEGDGAAEKEEGEEDEDEGMVKEVVEGDRMDVT